MIRARHILKKNFDERPDGLIKEKPFTLKERIVFMVKKAGGEMPKNQLHNIIGHSGHANNTLNRMVFDKTLTERRCQCGIGKIIIYKHSKRL